MEYEKPTGHSIIAPGRVAAVFELIGSHFDDEEKLNHYFAFLKFATVRTEGVIALAINWIDDKWPEDLNIISEFSSFSTAMFGLKDASAYN